MTATNQSAPIPLFWYRVRSTDVIVIYEASRCVHGATVACDPSKVVVRVRFPVYANVEQAVVHFFFSHHQFGGHVVSDQCEVSVGLVSKTCDPTRRNNDIFFNVQSLSTIMQISTIDDSDTDDEDNHVAYDANCNTVMNRRGHMRLCKDAMSLESLEKSGWVRMHTSGRNSYIFKRPRWILKVVKHYVAPNYYCPRIEETMYRIRLLCDSMGPLAPRVAHVRVCSWNKDPALTLLMRDEGETHISLPSVTDAQIHSVVQRLMRGEIISRDILTDTVKVNTGNLVFQLSPNGRRLSVRFLDVDVPTNFMSTEHVPVPLMERLWSKIVHTCLRRPVVPITYAEAYELSTHWYPLFTT